MKNECNVVRDLLPMYIDGVVSEDSRELVEEHVAQCHACKVIYAQMKDALPENGTQRDRQEFEQAARKLKIRRKRRTVVKVVAGVIAGFVLMLIAFSALENYYVPVGPGEYTATLIQTQADGAVYMDFYTIRRAVGFSSSFENGEYVFQVEKRLLDGKRENGMAYAGTSSIGYWSDGHLVTRNGGIISSISVEDSSGNRTVIFSDGDTIPYCSEEMERYYAAETAYEIFMGWRDEDKRNDLLSNVVEAYHQVREWQ